MSLDFILEVIGIYYKILEMSMPDQNCARSLWQQSEEYSGVTVLVEGMLSHAIAITQVVNYKRQG